MAADMTYEVIKARDIYRSIVEMKKKNEALGTKKNEADEYIRKLQKYSAVFPTSRPLHVVLANLYYETGDWNSAVAVLREFIEARERTGQTGDDDVATAWFNLACFYSSEGGRSNDDNRSKALQEAGRCLLNCLEAARTSGLGTLAVHFERAQTDDDLDTLRKSGIADPILAQFKTTQATSS